MSSEQTPYIGEINKQFYIALGLCVLGLFGIAGLHRFYTGKTGTGIFYLLTSGFFGIGTIMDIFSIITGHYRCKDGSPLYK